MAVIVFLYFQPKSLHKKTRLIGNQYVNCQKKINVLYKIKCNLESFAAI